MNETEIDAESISGLLYHQKSTVFVSLVATYIVYYLFESIKLLRKGKLPPGPPGIPLVGNLFQLSRDAWYRFTEWQETYGKCL